MWGRETQNTPADETSSAGARPWTLSIDILSKTTPGRIAATRSGGNPSPNLAKDHSMDGQSVDIILGHPKGELYRPGVLSSAFDPFTLQLFMDIGLEEGMRVLEIGSVNGDVALLAAKFVGPSGLVVGIEPSAEAVEFATGRAIASGAGNVRFIEASIDGDVPLDQPFDALVGRVVLMFLPSPAATLARLAKHVRPGGLILFQEPDMSWAKSVPNVPTVEKAAHWLRDIFADSGADSEFGPKLHAIFRRAGLPDPQMRVDGLIYGSDGAGPSLLTDSIRAILPAIEHFGLATAAEVDIDTLEQRMRAELAAADASMSSPLLVSAWSRISN
jgi:SAM-dependent methyltransferase